MFNKNKTGHDSKQGMPTIRLSGSFWANFDSRIRTAYFEIRFAKPKNSMEQTKHNQKNDVMYVVKIKASLLTPIPL